MSVDTRKLLVNLNFINMKHVKAEQTDRKCFLNKRNSLTITWLFAQNSEKKKETTGLIYGFKSELSLESEVRAQKNRIFLKRVDPSVRDIV